MAEKVIHEIRIIETDDGFRIEIKGDKEAIKKMGFGPFAKGGFGPGMFFGRGRGKFWHRHGPPPWTWEWGDSTEDAPSGGAEV